MEECARRREPAAAKGPVPSRGRDSPAGDRPRVAKSPPPPLPPPPGRSLRVACTRPERERGGKELPCVPAPRFPASPPASLRAHRQDRSRTRSPNPNPNPSDPTPNPSGPNPNPSGPQEKKIAHEKIAEGTEDIFQEPSKLGVKLSPEFLESCYTPIIQSGGKFDLKPSAFSNGDNLYYGAPAAGRPSLPAHARLTCLASRCSARLTTRLPPTRPLPTRRAL